MKHPDNIYVMYISNDFRLNLSLKGKDIGSLKGKDIGSLKEHLHKDTKDVKQ